MPRRDDLYLADILEAAARVSDETKKSHPHIPWRQARGMRNLLVHAYFAVDWDIIWKTATVSVPQLQAQIAELLETESEG